MTLYELYQKEKIAVIHGQSVRFRIIKYAILIPLFALMWWSFGWYITLQILGALFILSLVVHFFYRYKTNGWTKEWGGFKPFSEISK